MSAYYYLVAGLPNVSFPDVDKNLKIEQVLDAYRSIEENLGASDRALLNYFYYSNDNKNLIRAIENEKGVTVTHPEFVEPAVFAEEEIANYRTITDRMPRYMQRFLDEYAPRIAETSARELERALLAAFYAETAESDNAFVREYFRFDCDLRNILAAFNARKLSRSIEQEALGESAVTDAIKKSTARDFGLVVTHPYAAKLAESFENESFANLDAYVDTLRFSFADDAARRDRFSVDSVFAYVVALSIIRRILPRNAEAGKARLQYLIDGMKERYRIPV